jgi:hypothetical protein
MSALYCSMQIALQDSAFEVARCGYEVYMIDGMMDE